MSEIDPQSPDIALTYTGGRTPREVPARDLSWNDLSRIAYRRALMAANRNRSNLVPQGGKRQKTVRPDQPTADALETLATELSGSGAFAREAVTYVPTETPEETATERTPFERMFAPEPAPTESSPPPADPATPEV